MSDRPDGVVPFPTKAVPIIGRSKPVARIKINEDEVVEILPPKTDSTPEEWDSFGSFCGLMVMANMMQGDGPWSDILAEAARAYRSRWHPVITGD